LGIGRKTEREQHNIQKGKDKLTEFLWVIVLYPVGLEMCWLYFKFNVNDAKLILNGRIPDNKTQYNKTEMFSART